jgi:hypothetical protein
MTTQDQKDKKVAAAEKAVEDVQSKVTKAEAKLADVEKVYAEDKAAATAKIEALRPELAEVQEYLTWTRSMPVSGRASGPVGSVETPVADAE